MASVETLVAAGTVATATTNSSVLSITNQTAAVVAYLNVAAASGTSPTLTVTLQDSPDGVNWYPVPNGAMAAATAPGQTRLALPLNTLIGPNLRAVCAVGGTTPSFTFGLSLSLTD